MTIRDALMLGFEKLKKAGIDSYHLDTELLLAKALFQSNKPSAQGFLEYAQIIDRSNIFKINRDALLSKKQNFDFNKFIQSRSKQVPIAYLTHVKEFYGLPFYTDRRVLIPRPQTETLVEKTIKKLMSLSVHQLARTSIVDIGTGSGCIIISLLKTLQQHSVIASVVKTISLKNTFIATEADPKVLRVAQLNAQIHGVLKSITFLKTDSLPIVKTDHLMVVANLPYLDPNLKKKLYLKTPELHYEPQRALFAPDRGLACYKKLVNKLLYYKKKHISTTCFFEIDPHQGKTLSNFIHSTLTSEVTLLAHEGIVIVTL